MSDSDRHLIAQIAAHTSWANTPDRTARTSPARDTFLRKFEDQVDPQHVLTPLERAKRAEHARKAYFTSLALRSARSRRGQNERRQALDELRLVTAMLAEADHPEELDDLSTPAGADADTGDCGAKRRRARTSAHEARHDGRADGADAAS